MHCPIVFVKASYGCDNGRPVARSFAHEIGSATDGVWDHLFRPFSILNRQVVLAELLDPPCKAFRGVTHCCKVFQALMVGVDHGGVPVVDIDSPRLKSILDCKQLFFVDWVIDLSWA